MEDKQIIQLAKETGFFKAEIVDTAQIVFDKKFRPYCEVNYCGQYGANYSCPPDCGTVEEMKNRVLNHKKALVLMTQWNVADLSDVQALKHGKQKHNAYTFKLIDKLKEQGHDGFMIGASGCSLCSPCLLKEGKPCAFPEKRYSCMSAYCIFVKDLAQKCNMEYDYKDGLLAYFGMYVFD